MPGEMNPYDERENLVSPESIKTLGDALNEMREAIETLGKQFMHEASKDPELKRFVERYNNSKSENDADLELTKDGKFRVFKRVEVNTSKEKKLPKKFRNGW